MARKGSAKVRTGCLTCKVRKVKCDEAKPHCNRCTRTGRKCDGYAPPKTEPPQSSLTWHRPQHLFYGIGNTSEGRAMQFFCEVAGPFLPGTTDPYFWTHIVMQFCNFEPAVRHSVIAISSLYEKYQIDNESDVSLQSDAFALQHYNAAIRELQKTDNQPLVLLVCILFICIEFLQSNKEAAIQHCRHGINVLQQLITTYPWTKEHLVPIFRRLSLFPFFFGKGASDFPSLVALEEQCPEQFESFEDARAVIDGIMSRAMRLVRLGDEYRIGVLRDKPVTAGLRAEQKDIQTLLDQWRVAFAGLEAKMSAPDSPVVEYLEKIEVTFVQKILCTFLSISHEISSIWTRIAFASKETDYDEYLSAYQGVVNQAMTMARPSPEFSEVVLKMPKFLFEMGFLPLFYFVVVKCRCFETRLAALKIMQLVSVNRESLWDVKSTFAMGRRLIEIEHGVRLDNQAVPLTKAAIVGLPPEEMRVHGTWTEPGASALREVDGKMIVGKMVGFYMLDDKGTTLLRTEFLPDDLDAARWDGFTAMKTPAMTQYESSMSSTPIQLSLAS